MFARSSPLQRVQFLVESLYLKKGKKIRMSLQDEKCITVSLSSCPLPGGSELGVPYTPPGSGHRYSVEGKKIPAHSL